MFIHLLISGEMRFLRKEQTSIWGKRDILEKQVLGEEDRPKSIKGSKNSLPSAV
jgi:hypothetical protein